MMSKLDKIIHSTDFKNLVKKQNFLSQFFSCLVLMMYFLFISIIGFNPGFFSFKIQDSFFTYGIVLGLFIIVFSIFLTITYVLISNRKLDRLRKKINLDE